MNAREEILARVREALKEPAPAPGSGSHAAPTAAKSSSSGPTNFKPWLPLVGATFEDWRAMFTKNADLLKATFKVVPSVEAAAAEIRQLATQGQWKTIATHHSALTDAACKEAGPALLYTDAGYETAAMEKCEAGVTTCEALIAQTGSVLITSRNCGGRALSVLPPHHIVVATRDQLIPDLPAAFALLHQKFEGNYPSTMSFITGPSRTGDIERILVLGAHGPKQLTILLIAG
ncbi:MAG: LUD domain-containing protein [Verrucomicrobiota bacterium]